MVFGDTYGGVQGAAQSEVNSDRQFMLGLIAAMQAGQRASMEHEMNQQALLSSARNASLQQQDLAQKAYQFSKSQEGAAEDRRIREEIGLGGMDVAKDKIAALTNHFQAALALKDQEAANAGPALAENFSKVLQDNKEATDRLQKAQESSKELSEQIARQLAAKHIKVKVKNERGDPVYAAADESDFAGSKLANSFNDALRERQLELAQAAEEKKKADQQVFMQTRAMAAQKFQPDPISGKIVHLPSQQSFPLQMPDLSNKKIRTFNPRTGRLEGSTSGTSGAPQSDTSQDWTGGTGVFGSGVSPIAPSPAPSGIGSTPTVGNLGWQ